jgi:hypothetical protein
VTEAPSSGDGFEPARGPIALFNTPMILLHVVSQVAVCPVYHSVPEGLNRRPVARPTQAHADEIAVLIDGAIEVWPLTLDFYRRLIHVLAVTDGATAFFAQGVR